MKYRLDAGWGVDKAIETPICRRKKYLYNGELLDSTGISEITGVSPRCFSRRIRVGWSIEKAANTPEIKHKENKNTC
mgnify:CR=1 FL=1